MSMSLSQAGFHDYLLCSLEGSSMLENHQLSIVPDAQSIALQRSGGQHYATVRSAPARQENPNVVRLCHTIIWMIVLTPFVLGLATLIKNLLT